MTCRDLPRTKFWDFWRRQNLLASRLHLVRSGATEISGIFATEIRKKRRAAQIWGLADSADSSLRSPPARPLPETSQRRKRRQGRPGKPLAFARTLPLLPFLQQGLLVLSWCRCACCVCSRCRSASKGRRNGSHAGAGEQAMRVSAPLIKV